MVNLDCYNNLSQLKIHSKPVLTPRAYGGGVSGVSGNPLDSKAISKITYLNKYTIIILASYAYLSTNTI